tara:strand:+ start:2094 stop:2477 length:384 start_codon:yes stop_codon:yes gene_type:complete
MFDLALKIFAHGLLVFIFGTSHLFGKINENKKNKNISSQNDKWIAIDKLQHFSYSCFLSFGTQYILVNKLDHREGKALPFSSLLSLSAGILKEINDKRGGSYFSYKDMVANGIGILTAGIIINFEPD